MIVGLFRSICCCAPIPLADVPSQATSIAAIIPFIALFLSEETTHREGSAWSLVRWFARSRPDFYHAVATTIKDVGPPGVNGIARV